MKKSATGPIQNIAINVPTPNVPCNKTPIINNPASITGLTTLKLLFVFLLKASTKPSYGLLPVALCAPIAIPMPAINKPIKKKKIEEKSIFFNIIFYNCTYYCSNRCQVL